MSENAAIPLGPFDLVQPAGRGAMAEVWRAIHRARGVPVAVKVVTAPAGRAERYRRMFADEVRSTARLDHPGVIRLHDHGEIPAAVAEATGGRLPKGAPFLVMAWVDGGTLRGKKARMSWPGSRATLLALLDALAHAHARGVIHRDLKAANVLIGEHGPILTDFGLAFDREHVDADLESSARLGTPNFMAPEQVAGDWRALGPWTDLYALGCLAYTLVTGSAPFAGRGARRIMQAHLHEDPPPLRPVVAVPHGFEGWVRRLLQKHPDHRFRFAADAAVGLLALPDVVEEGDPDATFPDGDPLELEDVTLVTPPVFLPLDDVSWSAGPVGVDGRPPVPQTWRGPPPPPPEPPLTGVGRALFGLRETAFVGREAERDRLWQALRTVAEGQGARAVLIEGPAGQGKSHLAAWIAQRAHELGAAEPMRAIHDDVQSPACGLGPMLAMHLRCGDLPPDARLARIREALGDPHGDPLAERDADLAPALAAAMSTHRRFTDQATAVTLFSDRERYETLCRGFAHLTRRRPLILWFDDGQWGLDALRFTEYLLGRHAHLPVLVITTVRDDALAAQDPAFTAIEKLVERPEVERLRLGPLDGDTLARMVRNRLPIGASLADLLARRTGGSPLFAEQLVHHWIRIDALSDGPDGFRLKSGAEAELPGDLAAVWQARLDGVLRDADEAAWQALEAAAVLGIAVEGGEWAAVCARAGLTVPAAAVERLLDERLARLEEGSRWAFAHAMLRETLVQRARDAGRYVDWNARCAEMLAATPGRDPARLAGHLVAAGRHEAALEPLLDATRVALERGDYPAMRRLLLMRARALRAARRPLGDPAWVETRIYWARLDVVAERLPPARRRARRAVAAARGVGEPRLLALALIERGRVDQTDDPTRAVELYTEAREAARAAGDPSLEAEALRRTAWCLAQSGRFEQAEAMHEAAIACIGPTGDEFTLGGILHTRTIVAWKTGDLVRARRVGAEAMECFEHTGDRFGLGNVSNTLGDVARYDGDLAEAERWYRQALRLKNAVGSIAEDTELNLAVTLIEMGRYPEARERIEGVEARARRVGHPVILAFCAVTALPCDAWSADWASWDARWHDLDLFVEGKLAEPDAARSLRLAASMAASVGEDERAERADALAAAQEEILGRVRPAPGGL
ncbi:MAG: tetratricopeptide repeat protein [bacterium]